MAIERNAVAGGSNAHQGLMLCNWYGESTVGANVLQLVRAFSRVRAVCAVCITPCKHMVCT